MPRSSNSRDLCANPGNRRATSGMALSSATERVSRPISSERTAASPAVVRASRAGASNDGFETARCGAAEVDRLVAVAGAQCFAMRRTGLIVRPCFESSNARSMSSNS